MSDNDDPQPKRLIYQRREYVQQVRDRIYDDGIEYGDVPTADKRELAKAALMLWDALYEFRSESVLSEGDFPDISPVRDRVGRTTETVVASPRRGGGQQPADVPAIDEVDVWKLLELTEDLDDLANTLGFGASASDRPETSKFDESDLVTLVSARGQEDALAEAPDDITERVIDTLEAHNGD